MCISIGGNIPTPINLIFLGYSPGQKGGFNMGDFKEISYFLVCDERREIINVSGPGETKAPTCWKGEKYRKVNTWDGIEEAADLIAEYKWIPYRQYKADILAGKLKTDLKLEVEV